MRRISFVILIVVAIAAAYALGRHHADAHPGSRAGRHALYYVDPMHPAYTSDKPGIAPDCGMPLEPVYATEAGSGPPASTLAQSAAGQVTVEGETRQLLGIRVAAVEKKAITRSLRVVGRVVPEDTRVYRINSGVDGFIRETHNDSVGMQVKKDQKLATYYSPEFLSAASGFLAATERVPGAVGTDGSRTMPFPGALSKQGVGSVQGYTDRLRNLGMSDAQIKYVADNRQLPESIEVVAPADGFILARNISAGQHFDHDMEFYRIADLSRVWVVAEVYEQEAQYLRPGAMAQVALKDEGRQLPAHVTDSLPQSETGGGTVKIRLEVDNSSFVLRPEMLVDVDLPVHLPAAVTVPLDALVDSGAHARVYVESREGVFEPREVDAGWRLGDQVEILRGVQPGERVVVGATFLVDSESRLKAPPATAALSAPKGLQAHMRAEAGASKTVKDPSCGMSVDPVVASAAGNTLGVGGTTYYFCSQLCRQKFQNKTTASITGHQGDND